MCHKDLSQCGSPGLARPVPVPLRPHSCLPSSSVQALWGHSSHLPGNWSALNYTAMALCPGSTPQLWPQVYLLALGCIPRHLQGEHPVHTELPVEGLFAASPGTVPAEPGSLPHFHPHAQVGGLARRHSQVTFGGHACATMTPRRCLPSHSWMFQRL